MPVYGFFETLQLIVHLPLVSVNMPGKVTFFMEPLVNIVRFNFYGVNEVLQEKWGISRDDMAFSQVFYQFGYKYTSIIPNLGFIIWLMVVAVILLIFALIKDFYAIKVDVKHPSCRARIAPTMTNFLFRLMMLCFLEIVICCWINYSAFDLYDMKIDRNSAIVSVVIGAICFLLWFFVTTLTCAHRIAIDETAEEVSPYYATLFHGLNKQHPLRSALYPTWFLCRRVLFALAVLVFPAYPLVQIFLLTLTSVAMLYVLWG